LRTKSNIKDTGFESGDQQPADIETV
jgi:hypothetical protein